MMTSSRRNNNALHAFIRAAAPLLLILLKSPFLARGWEPTWESLDSRPIPAWYDEAKFGIFIHWGVFSVPSFHSEWFWERLKSSSPQSKEYLEFVNKTERPNFSYQEYAPRFDASLFEPEKWADLFGNSGAQYVVLTSKHHDGFCNWDSRDVPSTWNWNAMDIGPKRDLVGDLGNAIKKKRSPRTGRFLRWGLYHSLFEWFHPAYLSDKANHFKTNTFPAMKSMPELYDLVNKYEPELLWSDGDWDAPDTYWNSTAFLAWYATNSTVNQTAVWNDRWGNGCHCQHGSFWTCHDRYQPGHLVKKKWENALTIDKTTWGYSRSSPVEWYLSVKTLVHELVQTVAFGGNMLLNIGPAHDGTISPIFGDRLLGMGDWLKVNGRSIYGTTPWALCQNETTAGIYYTRKGDTLFAIATKWSSNTLTLRAPRGEQDKTRVQMLGHDGGDLPWNAAGGRYGMVISLPDWTPDTIPGQHAWAFEITGVANLDDDDEGVYGKPLMVDESRFT